MKTRKIVFDPFFYVSFCSLIILFFFIGLVFGTFKIYPYSLINAAYEAGNAYYVSLEMKNDTKFETDLWRRIRTEYLDSKGLTEYRPGFAYDGLTLYTSGHDQTAVLIDMEGRVLHEWHLPLKEVWESDWNHNTLPKDEWIYIRDAYLYPDGNIILLYTGWGNTPWGLALVMVDKNSEILWKQPIRAHHDLDVGPDGKIYSLSHETLKKLPKHLKFIPGPIVDDAIVIFAPDGKKLKEISILNAFYNSEYRRMLNWIKPRPDFFHANTVVLVTPKIAKKFSFAEAGQVLVCMRNLGSLVLIDPWREKVTWVMTGPWSKPHDPDFLENGNMMIFDNLWNKNGKQSRILEFNPFTTKKEWQYHGDEKRPFYSEVRSRQQALPNGNVLICESDGGRLVEVNRNQEIVWEFVNPAQETFEGKQYISIVSTGRRFGASELNFIQERE